ncbi:MAG: hypothetical protein Q9206_002660, partial [Seirophora lacunosa]
MSPVLWSTGNQSVLDFGIPVGQEDYDRLRPMSYPTESRPMVDRKASQSWTLGYQLAKKSTTDFGPCLTQQRAGQALDNHKARGPMPNAFSPSRTLTGEDSSQRTPSLELNRRRPSGFQPTLYQKGTLLRRTNGSIYQQRRVASASAARLWWRQDWYWRTARYM